MPDFWQFQPYRWAWASNGNLPGAVPQISARAGIADTKSRKVWAFLGDGETGEPESLGAISLAGREQLDNLIFVINCSLQRLTARSRQQQIGTEGLFTVPGGM